MTAFELKQNGSKLINNIITALTVLHLLSRNSFMAMAFCPYIMGEI